VLYGGSSNQEQRVNLPSKGYFVQPTIIEIDHSAPVVQHEAFVPCLYVMKVKSFEDAVAKNNAVKQGLSSSLFTRDMRDVFRWMGPRGSDCGIVNVNAGTSGAVYTSPLSLIQFLFQH
jgi:aldehyde dehydrogenase family 7 protein A1